MSWLIRKDSDAGKARRLEETGATEDETIEWHEFEQATGSGEGHEASCAALHAVTKELDTTEWLNNIKGSKTGSWEKR